MPEQPFTSPASCCGKPAGAICVHDITQLRPTATPLASPAEHCGHQPPCFSEHTPPTECVLRPDHQGSHANEHGMRWWERTDGEQHSPAGGLADVQGRCPACGHEGLVLGDGGYVTCPRLDCPQPDAASTLLEQARGTTSITIDPALPDLTVVKYGRLVPACPEGRHFPPHPGETCDEADAFITARDQLITNALTESLRTFWDGVTGRWLHGNGTGSITGVLPVPRHEPTPEQRAMDILRPHLAAETLYQPDGS